MAITATLKFEGLNTTDLTDYTTASLTPVAGRLYLLAVSSGKTTGATDTPTVSGAGLTWVQINTIQSTNHRTTVFRAMGTGSAGVLTIDHGTTPTNDQGNCAWRLTEIDGVATSGSNGADAIVQNQTGTGTGSTTASLAFTNTVGSGNATFGAYNQNTTSADVVAGTGFTMLGDDANTNPGTPSTRLACEYSLTGTAPVTFTVGSGASWGMVIVELNAIVSSSGSDTLGVAAGESSATQAQLGVGFGSFEEGFAGGALNLALVETSANTQLNTGADTLGLAITESGVVSISTPVSGADTPGIQITQASTVQTGNALTDTLGLAITQTSVLASNTTSADTPTLAAGESSVLDYIVNFPGTGVYPTTRTWPYNVANTPQSGSDTLGAAAGESSTVQAGLSGADTPTLAVTETKLLDAFSAQADTLGLAITESSTTLAIIAVTDTLGLAAGESSATQNAFTGADTLGLAAGESSANKQLNTGADTLGLAITESGAVAIVTSVSGTDTPTLSAGESSANKQLNTGADTLGLAITESGALQAGLSASADTLGLAAGESSVLDYVVNYPSTATYPGTRVWPVVESAAIPMSVSDSLVISAGESSTTQVGQSGSDTPTLSAGESSASALSSAVTDTPTLAGGESSLLASTSAVTDTLGLAAGESSANKQINTGADTLGLAITESAAVVVVTFVSVSDTLGLAITESSTVANIIPGADTLALQINQASATLATNTGADTLGLAAGESGSVFVLQTSVSGADTPTLQINQTSLIDYVLNYPSTATYPGTHVWPSASATLKTGSDTLTLSAAESGSKSINALVEYWGFLPV